MPDGSAYQTIGEPRSEGIPAATIYNNDRVDARQVSSRPSGGGVRSTSNGGRVAQPKATDPKKVGEWSARYNDILADIWNSKTPAERAQKVSEYKPELNSLGEALDIDVSNDVGFILGQ